ncbi:MAG: cob(I)yrinic acid a,c-diamide adenosyltransferase [Candidatus Vogelbacteria bacterium]|nr:cob(I)yrinic acid a,c-diamide adenosyltransferase [Candidatus Vogelbacteria bacterium]
MLFTGKGDGGTTSLFGCKQRISKSSAVTEALGNMDEINSFLGVCKVVADKAFFRLPNRAPVAGLIDEIQQNLFIVQAELAGSAMAITEDKVKKVEEIIGSIEAVLPPIHSFFVSGGTEVAALFDFARTIARRAERRVVAAVESGDCEINTQTRAYLNRLSSILYALARWANHQAGINEEKPTYN